jgi:hypothetical protein
LQYTRLTHLLLTASEGASCSLEVLDDVAEQERSGEVRVVQSKSALTANPVADRAQSLWKTLANWLTAIRAANYPLMDTTFEIYVSRPVGGEIVDRFAKANTDADARSAIDHARKELMGEPPNFEKRARLSADIAPYVNDVLSALDAELIPIVRGLCLTCGSGRPTEDLLDLIRTHPVPPSKVEEIAAYVCGVVKNRVDALLEQRLPAVLQRDEIHGLYRAYCRKVDSDTVLTSYATRPDENDAVKRMPSTFVRQLELIGADYEAKLEAINDFLMAAADRTEWAARGDVDESSFRELDESLKRTWKNRRQIVSLEHPSLAAESQGTLLYRQCLETKAMLEAKDTPSHFIPGCLQRLADDLSVGWHPQFDVLLKAAAA